MHISRYYNIHLPLLAYLITYFKNGYILFAAQTPRPKAIHTVKFDCREGMYFSENHLNSSPFKSYWRTHFDSSNISVSEFRILALDEAMALLCNTRSVSHFRTQISPQTNPYMMAIAKSMPKMYATTFPFPPAGSRKSYV